MAVYTEMDFGSILSDAELDSDVDNSDFDLNGGASSWIPKGNQMDLSAVNNICRDKDLSEVDFDAILGELSQLELQLTNQQNQQARAAASDATDLEMSLKDAKKTENTSIFKDYSNLKSHHSPVHNRSPVRHHSAPSKANNKSNELEFYDGAELDLALSELSALIGDADLADANSSEGNSVKNHVEGSRLDQKQILMNSRTSKLTNNNEDSLHPMTNSKLTPHMSKHSQDNHTVSFSKNNLHRANWNEASSDSAQNDSAFDDNISLPSSGSRVSMATSSRSSGSSINNSLSMAENEECSRYNGESLKQVTTNDQNTNKIFVRIYSPEGASHNILVSERMTVCQALDMFQNNGQIHPLSSTVSTSIVELLPNLYMERLLEDHDILVDCVHTWTRDSDNRLMIAERPDKYDVFINPEHYLAAPDDRDKKCSATIQKVLIQEFLDSNCRVPDLDGTLYLKSDGKKSWKKMYFVLRASGIYYSQKGRSKSLIDLVCLQKLDLVELYTGIGWKKKYKAPNDFGFALKHPQIQKNAPKYIKYLCPEDERSKWNWINSIRLAKLGIQLHKSFTQRQNILKSRPLDSAALVSEKVSEFLADQTNGSGSSGAGSSLGSSHSATQLLTFFSDATEYCPSRRMSDKRDERDSLVKFGSTKVPQLPISTQVTKQISLQQSPFNRSPKSSARFDVFVAQEVEIESPSSPPPLDLPIKRSDNKGVNSAPLTHSTTFNICNGTSDARPGESGIGAISKLPELKGVSPAGVSPAGVTPAGVSPAGMSPAVVSPASTFNKRIASPKHAVIKRAPSTGHREIEDQLYHQPYPQSCPQSPRHLPSPTKSVHSAGSLMNKMDSQRRDLHAAVSSCDSLAQPLPKPKPPLPPKRKDGMKPSFSVDSSPTKSSSFSFVENIEPGCPALNAVESQDIAILRRTSSNSQTFHEGNKSFKSNSSFESSSRSNNFLDNLNRVLLQKQNSVENCSQSSQFSPASNLSPDIDNLPPPPAELLEGLAKVKKSNPPPTPQRSKNTHLTYK